MLVNVFGMPGLKVINLEVDELDKYLRGRAIELDERDFGGEKSLFIITHMEIETKSIRVSPLAKFTAYPTTNEKV